MRFSAVIEQIARLGQAPVKPVDAARVKPQPSLPRPADKTPQELPADLDQRVRLVGEW